MRKMGILNGILTAMKRVVVAYSGGLDSTFLVKAAVDSLGHDNVIAVTARSETYPDSEYEDSRKISRTLKVKQLVIRTSELKDKKFSENPVDRCYYCKSELFGKLNRIKDDAGFSFVLDGTNADDLKDIRHGRKAALELGVRSPLLEAGIGKDLIRSMSRRMGLVTWDKPSYACLASRIPFGTPITKKELTRIDIAENYLRSSGFKQVRIRVHGDIARLEFYLSDIKSIINEAKRRRIVKRLKSLGFKYICLDMEGYRTGSMHEAVDRADVLN